MWVKERKKDSRQRLKLRGKRKDKGAENCIMKNFMSSFLYNIITVISFTNFNAQFFIH